MDPKEKTTFEDGSRLVIAAMIEVHKELGPGLMEAVYESCLVREFELRGMKVARQVPIRLTYKGVPVECAYRMDLVVQERFVIEIKCVEMLLDVHTAQLITYLKLSGYPIGFLVNFNTPLLKDQLRRFRRKKDYVEVVCG